MKKRPKCDAEMEMGILDGAPDWSRWDGVFYRKACEVSAYHCPECGYIMLHEKDK